MFEQMYYSDFTEKEAQIGKIDGNLEQLSKNDRRFLEILHEAQERMRTTMRFHCHSNRKVSKSQMTEVKF